MREKKRLGKKRSDKSSNDERIVENTLQTYTQIQVKAGNVKVKKNDCFFIFFSFVFRLSRSIPAQKLAKLCQIRLQAMVMMMMMIAGYWFG